MDTPEDIRRQKVAEHKEALRMAMCDACEKCEEHNEDCPFYDSEEETWDYEECYKVKGWE